MMDLEQAALWQKQLQMNTCLKDTLKSILKSVRELTDANKLLVTKVIELEKKVEEIDLRTKESIPMGSTIN